MALVFTNIGDDGHNHYNVNVTENTCDCQDFISGDARPCRHLLKLKPGLTSRDCPGYAPVGNSMIPKFIALCNQKVSTNFYMRDFLLSVESATTGVINYPTMPEQDVMDWARRVSVKVLEPMWREGYPVKIIHGYINERLNSVCDFDSSIPDSCSHCWDRGDFAVVDFLPNCFDRYYTQSGAEHSLKTEVATWIVSNTVFHHLYQWADTNLFRVIINSKQKRKWTRIVQKGKGDGGSNRIFYGSL